jgi:putative oxidoreductase
MNMTRNANKHDVSLLLLRVAAGIIFIAHGWQKVANPAAFANFFAMNNFPAFMVYVVGYAELIGGILLVIGLWTGIAASVLAVIIAVALFYVKGGALFRSFNVPIFEIDLALLAITVSLALKGSGSLAVVPSNGCCDKCATCEVKPAEPSVSYPQNNS